AAGGGVGGAGLGAAGGLGAGSGAAARGAAAAAAGGGGGGVGGAGGAAGVTAGMGFVAAGGTNPGTAWRIVSAELLGTSISTLKGTAPNRNSWPLRSGASLTRWLSRNVPFALA